MRIAPSLSKKVANKLKAVCRKYLLVRIDRRPLTKDDLEGYVVGLSDTWILVHMLDPNMYLNGYAAIRTRDIRRYRMLSDANHFASRALKKRGLKGVPQPRVSLQEIQSLLASAGRKFPLITIYDEKKDSEVCYIGKIQKLKKTFCVLKEITTGAKWNGLRRFRLDRITRVDFGGGYETALALVGNVKYSILNKSFT